MSSARILTYTAFLNSDLARNFQDGDLLYGLNGVRNANGALDSENSYFHLLYKYFTQHKRDLSQPIIVDVLNEKVLTCANGPSNQHEINHLNKTLNAKDPKVSAGRTDFPENNKGIAKIDRIRRRGCKARLLDADITKHFLLDGINPHHLFDRTFSEQNSQDFNIGKNAGKSGYTSFTSAEMRYIFRHFSDVTAGKGIKFYKLGKEMRLSDVFDWLATSAAHDGKRAIDRLITYLKSKEYTTEQLDKIVDENGRTLLQCIPRYVSSSSSSASSSSSNMNDTSPQKDTSTRIVATANTPVCHKRTRRMISLGFIHEEPTASAKDKLQIAPADNNIAMEEDQKKSAPTGSKRRLNF